MTDESSDPDERYKGCRMFVSATGRSGFALGMEGEREGWLFDFFVNEEDVAPDLMALAVAQGARQLVTYEHPFFEAFFSRFGFRTRDRVHLAQLRNPPRDWIPGAEPNACPDFLCMALGYDQAGPWTPASETREFAARPGTTFEDACCTKCGAALPRLRWLGILDGYHCMKCGFQQTRGALAVAFWELPASTSASSRSNGSSPGDSDSIIFLSSPDLLARGSPDRRSKLQADMFAQIDFAETLRARGAFDAARQQQEFILATLQRLLGVEHRDTLTALNNLAGTLSEQGDLDAARSHQMVALEASQRVLGAEHPNTLRARNNLAATLFEQGELRSAQEHQEAVLEASRRVRGEDHPLTVTARRNLAQTLHEQERRRLGTTRVTMGMYLDTNGAECSLEAPGWVDMRPHVAAANIDFSRVLGKLYIERPYPNLASAPAEFTVVDLRNLEDTERMVQEFVGHLQDEDEVRQLVRRRLGPDTANWRIVTVMKMIRRC